MRREVTVIADDLSGAADAAAGFAVAGLSTFVALVEGPFLPGCQVLAVDTDSRGLPPTPAAERTRAAARRAYAEGSRAIYKKIDSTLRGNVGVEIAAAFDAADDAWPGQGTLALVSPAFPAAGRALRDGRVFVRGVPLEDTDVWRKAGDHGPPDLASGLRAAGLAVFAARPSVLRRDPEHLERLAARGAQAVVCDAEDAADLEAIAVAGAGLRRPVVWSGSAGLARHLPSALGLCGPEAGRASASAPRPPDTAAGPAGPVLLLVGSRSEIARDQALCVAAEAGVASVFVPAAVLRGGERGTGWREVATCLAQALGDGRDVVLAIAPEADDGDAAHPDLAAALGRLAAPFRDLRGLVATGGETARAALCARGEHGLHLTGEVEPGVPLGVTDGALPLRVITKAGAFGTASTLARCRLALAAPPTRSPSP